jgi:hypothetical protein
VINLRLKDGFGQKFYRCLDWGMKVADMSHCELTTVNSLLRPYQPIEDNAFLGFSELMVGAIFPDSS